MNPQEIRELSDVDIQEKLETEQAALNKMKLDHVVSDLENPNQIKEKKKIVARLKTILREKELSEENKAKA